MRFIGKRIAARLKAEGPNADVVSVPWKAIILRDPCVFCVLGSYGDGRMELEHIAPRKRGGHNGWTNIAPACKAHNTFKADYPLWWMLWRLNEQRLGYVREQPIRFSHEPGRPRVAVDWMTVYARRLPRRARPPVRLGSDPVADVIEG